ncbi:MAG: gamma-glutamyltransferase, partial [Oscillospiraceae bacterium]|nr:gamma-glutamyltransferase [Oscillospiraceae bacterium]
MLNPREINLADPKWLPGDNKVVTDVEAAVSTDNAIVTYTMLKVLREGGNAVDATVAGNLVQCAVEPFMTNLTGTVTMLYYNKSEDKYYQLDSTGYFPSDLPGHMPVPEGKALFAVGMSPRSVIPGMMPGLKAMHEKFGSKPWDYLCEEAIWWAENGHHVSVFEYQCNYSCQPFTTFFPEGRKFYMPEGVLKSVGERFASPEMAETLRQVAKHGPDYMITGGWADDFIEKGNEMGWHIRKDHMTENPPRWIEPIRSKIRDFEIVSLAPPQQQGLFVSLVLGILDKLELDKYEPYSAEHIFFMSHALKL